MDNQAIEPTRDQIPIDKGVYERAPILSWTRSYDETYVRQLKTIRGSAFKKRTKKQYRSILLIYFEELLAELKKGIAVWLPHQIGMIELALYRGFLPSRRKGQAQTAFWFYVLWKKRDGIKYPSMFQLKIAKEKGYRLKLDYDKNPEGLLKLRQL